jgi:hypothetical protein
MGFETAAEPPVQLGADGQQSQLCPRPTAGSSKLLRCIEVLLLEQLSPESAKQCMILTSLISAKLSVQPCWDVEQRQTDRYACRMCATMTCPNNAATCCLAEPSERPCQIYLELLLFNALPLDSNWTQADAKVEACYKHPSLRSVQMAAVDIP